MSDSSATFSDLWVHFVWFVATLKIQSVQNHILYLCSVVKFELYDVIFCLLIAKFM